MTEAIVPAVEPIAPEQKRHEYQPTDEQGRPIGGKQVIVYTTEQEKFEKMQEANILLIRQLRKVTRDNRLGISSEDSVPDSAERMTGIIEFKEQELSSQQRFELSQKLNDPEHFVEARDTLLESAIGVSPAKLREFLSNQQIFEIQQRAADNYLSFAYADKSFYDCMENRSTLTDWMFKKGLAPTVANFNYASSTLREAGLLLGAPEQQHQVTPAPIAPVVTEAETQPPVVAAPRIGSEPQPQPTRQSRVPSGLNERVSSAAGSTPTTVSGVTNADGISLTLRDINRMPPDELRRRLADPAFVQLVEKLETESKQRKAALGLSKF